MTDSTYARRTTCRACDEGTLHTFLNLGPQPLANALPASEAEFADERTYPLDVALCTTCGLVQIHDIIDPEVLFGHYLYVTGVSSTIHDHNRAYAEEVTERLDLGSDDTVVEVASNDGSLLRQFQELGVSVLGVEPARNIAQMAIDAGVPTENVFFGAEVAKELRARHGAAAAIIGNNVLAHVNETVDFLEGFAALLRPGGRGVVEVPYLGEFLDRLEYDTVYHEHHCYFSVSALMFVAERAGLRVDHVREVSVHGGSIRVYFGLADELKEHGPTAVEYAARERAAGFLDPERYDRFARDVAAQRIALLEAIDGLRSRGLEVAAYGAPAKGHTLVNYCGIGPDRVPFTVDRNPLKVGRYTPGTHIPILPVTAIAERKPDVLLLLPWNFADEIMEQQAAFREAGGRFLIPIPSPRIV